MRVPCWPVSRRVGSNPFAPDDNTSYSAWGRPNHVARLSRGARSRALENTHEFHGTCAQQKVLSGKPRNERYACAEGPRCGWGTATGIQHSAGVLANGGRVSKEVVVSTEFNRTTGVSRVAHWG